MRLPAISARAGHRGPRATLGYVADTTPEGEFVRDIFGLSTPAMITKWYGGEAGAGRFLAGWVEAAAAQLAAHRH
jgi:hypothetical protein